jgi:PAS domain S-box-containing protein
MDTLHISLLVQGLGGLFLVLVCSTLYAYQRRRYFLYWTVAWFCFSLGLLLDSLALPENAVELASSSPRPWLQAAAVVCVWWHSALWVFGMLHFWRGHAAAPSASEERRGPEPSTALQFSWVHALILVALAPAAVVTSLTLPDPARPWLDVLEAAVRMGVYAWSAALCARVHGRWGQSGAMILAIFLAAYALQQLYATGIAAVIGLGWSGPGAIRYLGFADFLLQTLTVAGMIAVLLSEEHAALRYALSRLAETEDRFRLLFENSAVGMALFTAEGRFLQVNPAIVRIFGYGVEELRGRRLADLAYGGTHSPDTASSSLQALVDPPELYEREKQYVHKAGHAVWARMLRVPVRGPTGEVRYFVGVLEDVTQRRQAEEALAASEERYRLHFQDAFDGIYVCAENGEFLDANPSFYQTLGYTQAELLHRTVADVAEDLTQVRRHFAAVLGQGGDRFETRLRCKDGSRVDVEVSGAVVRLEGRRLIHGIVRDMTEHKRLEEQFRQAQKMQAIGRLAGGVAHDFNNLLTVITGYSELLLQETQPADASGDLIREIIRAADRAAALTRQLLAFSRKQILLPVELDLNKIVTNLDKMLRRLIGEDIDLRMVLGSGLHPVKADPTQVEQVILNLAVNARDAMPAGGRLTVETANAELDESFTRERREVQPGLYVMVRVSDTGHGMDRETKAHLFEPFFTTKELGKGTGLGLATVYGIVKQSGGHIYVESEPGRGAAFTIYLPALGAGALAPAAATDADELPRGTEVVLLVEDGDEVRQLARQVLENRGYLVLEAGHGGEALDLCARQARRIDLLVTDVIMPQMSGRELAERLASTQPGLRVLYLSGYTDAECLRRGLIEGDRAFLPKPFTPKALARKVREVLDQ